MCIVHYNNNIVINLPYELVGKVKPYSSCVWNYCKELYKDNLIRVDDDLLDKTLLPRTNGKFRRNGLIVNKNRYKNLDFKERYLNGGDCIVAYNPNNVSRVWLYENGNYYEFNLIDEFFKDMSLDEVNEIKNKKKEVEKAASKEQIISEVELEQIIRDCMKSWDLDKNE